MAEMEYGRLIWRGFLHHVQGKKLLERNEVIDGILHFGIGKVVPLLQEVDL